MSTPPTAASRYNVRIPSLFEIFFGKLANWFRQLKQWRKQGLLKKALQAARRRRAMRLEALEPRLLLSADPIAALDFAHVDDGNSFDHTVVLDTQDATESDSALPADAPAGEVAELDLTGIDAAGDEPPPINAVADITLTLDSSSEAIFGAQTVYLSFDGAQDVDYNGPIVIADLDVGAFMAPTWLEGQEADIIAATLGREFDVVEPIAALGARYPSDPRASEACMPLDSQRSGGSLDPHAGRAGNGHIGVAWRLVVVLGPGFPGDERGGHHEQAAECDEAGG